MLHVVLLHRRVWSALVRWMNLFGTLHVKWPGHCTPKVSQHVLQLTRGSAGRLDTGDQVSVRKEDSCWAPGNDYEIDESVCSKAYAITHLMLVCSWSIQWWCDSWRSIWYVHDYLRVTRNGKVVFFESVEIEASWFQRAINRKFLSSEWYKGLQSASIVWRGSVHRHMRQWWI